MESVANHLLTHPRLAIIPPTARSPPHPRFMTAMTAFSLRLQLLLGAGVLRGGAELKRSEENWRWASWVVVVVEGGRMDAAAVSLSWRLAADGFRVDVGEHLLVFGDRAHAHPLLSSGSSSIISC